jgi:hypothetical protein
MGRENAVSFLGDGKYIFGPRIRSPLITSSVFMERGWEGVVREVEMLMISCWEGLWEFGVRKDSEIRRFWFRRLGVIESVFSMVRHSLVRGS